MAKQSVERVPMSAAEAVKMHGPFCILCGTRHPFSVDCDPERLNRINALRRGSFAVQCVEKKFLEPSEPQRAALTKSGGGA